MPIRIAREQAALVLKDDLDVDYTGIDKATKAIVKDLILLSHQLLTSLAAKDGRESVHLVAYIRGIGKYLQYPGLVSWLACRCGISIIQAFVIGERNSSGRRGANKRELLSLMRDLQPFYDGPVSNDLKNSSKPSSAFRLLTGTLENVYYGRLNGLLYGLPVYERRLHGKATTPRYVRLERGGKTVALLDILKEHIASGRELPFTWMTTMSFSAELVRPLVEQCTSSLPRLLACFGGPWFRSVSAPAGLRVQDTRRILTIARRTDDPKTLAGAATALAGSRFLRVAEASIILKLLRAAPRDSFAATLFPRIPTRDVQRNIESWTKETAALEEIAEAVLQSPTSYGFQTVCNAAAFLAEYKWPDLKPLLNEATLQEAASH